MLKSQYILRSIQHTLFIAVIAIFVSACSNTHSSKLTMDTVSHAANRFQKASKHKLTFEAIMSNFDIKSKILDQYAKWKNVRYQLGGISKRGIDCSAFIQNTFREQFSIKLPRSTINQKKLGIQIKRTKLLPGDLVFFQCNPSTTSSHVGIYLGNNLFVHAATSSGVMISNLNDWYWTVYYREARRILTFISSCT